MDLNKLMEQIGSIVAFTQNLDQGIMALSVNAKKTDLTLQMLMKKLIGFNNLSFS